MTMDPKMRFSTAAALVALITQSYALDIVVTNDDGYETKNVQQLKLTLEEAGHNVLVSVPCAHQSGKGGAMGSYLKPVPVHLLKDDGTGVLSIDDSVTEPAGYCVGDLEADKETKTFNDFIDGTPLQASLHGIAKANELSGSNPDLVVSGPNEGQNLGFAVFISGTLGAAHAAIFSGVPAIAVSAGQTPGDDADALAYAKLVAQATVKIVDALESTQRAGEPLLPAKTGLTVNLPDAGTLNESTPYRFTKVNWSFGSMLKFGNLGESGGYGSYYGYTEAQGLYGLNFLPGGDASLDSDSESEGVAMREGDGYITISTIDATENASNAKAAHSKMRLNALIP